LATKLRLLLDECLEGPLAAEIAQHRSLNVEYINETTLGNRGTTDETVVNYARQNRRIVVTPESRLNEHKFKICTHPGILIFKATKRHASHAGMLRDLMLSGVRSRCRHAVTYLKLDDTCTKTIAIFKERDRLGNIRETSVSLS
jgi:predicted nuclease of predicted toxin-antitoxin system